MKIRIAIITLKPDSEQVLELSNQLTAQGLKHEIILGVDGRHEFPSLEEGEKIDQAKSFNKRLVELTKSEVGCYLSHLRTIRKFYNAGMERICVLEDDILIEPDFNKVLHSFESLSEEFEHIRLMGLKVHKRKKVRQLDEYHQITRPLKGLCGTQGYVINRNGMEKVLRYGSVLTEPIDKFYDHFWDTDLRSYCVEPHVIWERPIVKSSILKASRGKATKSVNTFLRKHFTKLQRGSRRRTYLLKHWNDFFPAKKSAIPMGKTTRIR